MRHGLGLIVCLVALSLTASAADLCVAPKQQDVDPKNTAIPLCLVAKKVAMTLDQYNNDQETLKGAVPSLSKADFDFKTVTSTTGGFKFGILIFSVGASHQSTSTNEVTFSYAVPPPAPNRSLVVTPHDFSKDLIQMLQTAGQQISMTQSVGAARFKTLSVTLAYGVTWDFSGSATVPISLVTAGGALDHNRSDCQTIKLTFENPSPAKP